MNKIEDLVKEIAPAKEERPKTYTAEVSHTDEEGVVWVRLPGADQDTPTASTSAEVKMGDTVTVEWRNNKLYIAGNYTNPSAGVTRVRKAEQTAEKAMSDAETAQAAADSAQEAATQAITIAGDTDQHFWFTETGADTGAHITEATQEDFLADPTNGGGNLLARSNGIAVRDGLAELASFSASGAQIGREHEVRFFVTRESIALENDDDDAIFSVVEDAAGTITRSAVVATFADPSDVSTTTYTVSDSITASGAVAVFFETNGIQYTLDSTLATAIATAGSGVTIALTQDGVDYCQGLMTETATSGVLSIDYYITHYDKALMDMTGAMSVVGAGNIIKVTNNEWTSSKMSNTYIGAVNSNSGKSVYFGIGAGGQNRGIYDKTNDKWMIYTDAQGVTTVMGKAVKTDSPLTVAGHSSPIGTLLTTHLASAKSVQPSTGTALCSITLPAGTWTLVGYVEFPPNATGVRAINLHTTSGSTFRQVQVNAANGYTTLETTITAQIATNTTYYLNCWHNSSTALTMPVGTAGGLTNGIRAIRIA